MNFSQGSPASRGLAVLLVIVLVIISWVSIVGPLSLQINATSEQLNQSIEREQKLQTSIRRLSSEVEQIHTVNIEELLWSSPKAGEVTAGVQARLGEMATEHGVSLRSITSIPEQTIRSVQTIGLRVEGESDLKQFSELLSAVEHHTPLFVVNRSNIRRLDRSDVFSIQPVVFFQLDLLAPYQLQED